MSDPPLSDIEFKNKMTWVGTILNFGRDFLINSKIFRIKYFFRPKIGLTDLIRKLSDGNKSFRSMIFHRSISYHNFFSCLANIYIRTRRSKFCTRRKSARWNTFTQKIYTITGWSMSTKYRRKGDILRIGSKRKRIHHVWLSGWPKRVFSINFEPKKVTTNLKSTKYDRANAFDIPVIKRQSIYDAWEQRANPKFEFNEKFYRKYIYDVSTVNFIFEICHGSLDWNIIFSVFTLTKSVFTVLIKVKSISWSKILLKMVVNMRQMMILQIILLFQVQLKPNQIKYQSQPLGRFSINMRI